MSKPLDIPADAPARAPASPGGRAPFPAAPFPFCRRLLCRAVLPALLLALALAAATTQARAAQVQAVIGHLTHARTLAPTLSNLDPVPGDLGLAGARLGLADNAKTGRFLGHDYVLIEVEVAPDEDPLPAARALLAETALVVLDAPAETALAVADLPEAAGALLFNAGAAEDRLRSGACRANLLHTAASYAMRTDALAQFLVKKRWNEWALIEGPRAQDRAFAQAMRRSGEKFRLDLVGEKQWRFDADMRRSAAREVPLFTQDFDDHAVLVIADEANDFARYVPYNTWLPRPVAGAEGLRPLAWSRVVEQWGAAQLQNRFEELAERAMQSRDYAAWAAVRAIGEAVTRTGSAEVATLREYILGADFELAGFKGRPLTFRDWNGQMRQPIPLAHAGALASLAPLEGFLHQRNELDTLGLDAPESACTAFGENR